MACEICKNDIRGKGKRFCSRKCFGIGMRGHKPTNYKGGRLIHKGYIYILAKDHPFRDRDGYVLEHRLVMEKHLGRLLNNKEVVHHKNQKRGDNRIENLELVVSQSAHMKVHYPKGTHIYRGEHPRGALGKRWKIHRN